MTGRIARQILLLRRWVGPVALALVLVFSLWASVAPQARAAVHGDLAAAPVAAADQLSLGHEDGHGHCATPSSADEDDDGHASLQHAPATPCHIVSVQVGHLAAGAELVVFDRLIDVLRPGPAPAHSFTVLDPPFTPPRSR